MGYNSKRPHRVQLLSAENRNLRLQWAQAHQNWTPEDWKTMTWSDETHFLLCNGVGMAYLSVVAYNVHPFIATIYWFR